MTTPTKPVSGEGREIDRLFNAAINVLIAEGVFYACIAFVTLDPNPFHWPFPERIIAALLQAYVVLVAVASLSAEAEK